MPHSIRKYGHSPYQIAVIHGGPGGAGELTPVAKELSTLCGILEPLQTKITIEGQIEELHSQLQKEADLPITLVAFSAGAWLSCIFAAKYPSFVKKLILIGCPPFEEKYVSSIMAKRMERLSEQDKEDLSKLQAMLEDPKINDKNDIFSQFGKLFSKCDAYDPLEENSQEIEFRLDIYQSIMKEIKTLRSSNKLLDYVKRIKCPVLAIHGTYDPHPLEGVVEPFSKLSKSFNVIPLQSCGHCPWIERQAKDQFYKILKKELTI